MADEITYAVVGGPPADWQRLMVRDLDTGLPIDSVIEANTVEGWVLHHKKNSAGQYYIDGGEIATERLEGRFVIEYR